MSVISCESCVIVATAAANQAATFSITDTKLYVLVVTLSTQNNAKLLKKLKSGGFKRTITWNKYQSKISTEIQSQYLDYLIDPSFQGVEIKRRNTVEIKTYNVMIDEWDFLHQPVRNNLITYDNIQIAIGHEDDYTTGCLLDCIYFKNYFKMIGIDLSKQQVLAVDPRSIQQLNFTGNLSWLAGATMLFIIEKVTETVLDFSQGDMKVF